MVTPREQDEAAIRQAIEGLVTAIRAKNIEGVLAAYADELVAFDIVPPLRFVGAETFRAPWRDVFARYATLDYEVHALAITAGDDVAFSRSLNRIHGTMTDGKRADLWLRSTLCFRKLDGRWKIVHLHVSVPAELGTGKAAIDLRP